MSTRYIFKGNISIIGMAKNGSQAIKQIALRNPGWSRIEIKHTPEETKDIELKHYDSNHTIFIPIRPPIDRAISAFYQDASDKIIEKICNLEELPVTMENYTSELNYYTNDTIKLFFDKIYLNENWQGCKVYFFDLSKLSLEFKDYIDPTLEIPFYNISKESLLKVKIGEMFTRKQILKSMFNRAWLHSLSFETQIWENLKKTKYWLFNE